MVSKLLKLQESIKASWRGVCGVLLFGLLCSTAYADDFKRISIATGEYAPWSSQELEGGGFLHRIITEAFALQGIEVEYTYYPWARSYEEVKAGKHQVAAFWACSLERQEYFYCSDPIGKEDVVFFYHRDKPLKKWQGLDNLAGYKIGATKGYTYTKEFWDAADSKRLDVHVVTRDILNMKMLIRKRLDLVVMGYVAGVGLMNKNFEPVQITQIRYHPQPLTSLTFHLLVPRNLENGKELLHQFNHGIAKLRASGKYREHFNYYFPDFQIMGYENLLKESSQD